MSDPTSQLLVDRVVAEQWEHVRTYQAIDERTAAVVFADDLAAAAERASASVEPLLPWPSLPENQIGAFSDGVDLIRLHRIRQLVGNGDRVLEIGTGRGYMTGVLLRDRSIPHYCGVDINPALIESVEQMAEVNSLDLSDHHLETKNLFDLTPEFVAEHDPDVVLLLEVVEHVPDPQAALSTVAAAIPDDAILVFSVPLLGRIEACWGHVSLFDDVQIKELCRAAGLHVHNVEVLQNHWVLIVAGRKPLDDARLLSLHAPSSEEPTPSPTRDLAIRRLSLTEAPPTITEMPEPDELAVRGGQNGATITVRGGRGGLILPTPGAGFVRFEFGFADGWRPGKVWVRQYAEDGTMLQSWFWAAHGSRPKRDLLTHLFRPMVPNRGFEPIGPVTPGVVSHTAVLVQPAGSKPSTLLVRRAAYASDAAALRSASQLRRAMSAPRG